MERQASSIPNNTNNSNSHLSTQRISIVIPPRGFLFISGIASQYDTTYNIQLQSIMNEQEYEIFIQQVNNSLEAFWPCMPCFAFGYVCACCSFGLSFLLPNICLSEAEMSCRNVLNNFNAKPLYYDRKIQFELRKRCHYSYIEISFPSSLIQQSNATGTNETLSNPNIQQL